MEAIEERLEYNELLMNLDSLENIPQYDLPEGYSYSFWQSCEDLKDWVNVHINSGEFTYSVDAREVFNDFYTPFANEIDKRCFFIVDNKTNKRVATATISPADQHGYSCVVDWLAIEKNYWGKKLGKPLITRTLQLAKELGYDKILLHTQTHTWLAAKLYLDFGFEPFNTDEAKGWQILKTITNHEKLDQFSALEEHEMYFSDAVNIVEELNKLHKDYTYGIWFKNGRHEVWVRENDFVYKYQYYDNGKTLVCEINALDDKEQKSLDEYFGK
jgi:N-acetylglutamate synthase-like GNAT family acetyltransferase